MTGLLDLSGWPKGLRVIVGKEARTPERNCGWPTPTGTVLRHRRRARAEDRIRGAKDAGPTDLPLHDLDRNRIWCAIVALACELTA